MKTYNLRLTSLQASLLGASLHVPKRERFADIIAFVAGQTARGQLTHASQIQAVLNLGYARTQQLLNEMVKKKYISRRIWAVTGISYIYIIGPRAVVE